MESERRISNVGRRRTPIKHGSDKRKNYHRKVVGNKRGDKMKIDYMNTEQLLFMVKQEKMLFGYLAVRYPTIEEYFYSEDSKRLRIKLENCDSFFEEICIEDMFGFSPISSLQGKKEWISRLSEEQKEEFVNSPLYHVA